MRRDFEKYFTQLQLQYNSLQKVAEKVNKEIEEGKVTEEQRTNFINYFNTIKTNYDRISYARYLLRLPPVWIQKLSSKIETARMKKELAKYEKEKSDQSSVLEENKEALDNINKELEECKNL